MSFTSIAKNNFNSSLVKILLILLTTVGECFAQSSSTSNDRASLLGTKTPYQVKQIQDTSPPSGYKPVFINYVGRHGARFLTDSKDTYLIQKILFLAKQNGELTEQGIKLQEMLTCFNKIEKGNYGNITLSGKEEQEGIARRMYEHYPNVFKGNGLNIMMTQKVRTQQSAYAFLKELHSYPASKIHKTILPDSIDNDLRYFDISPAYRKYKKGKAIETRIDSLRNDSRMKAALHNLGHEFFRDNFLKKLKEKGILIVNQKGKEVTYGLENFVDNLYGLCAIQFSIQEETQKRGWKSNSVDFGPFFKLKDLQWLAFIDGAEDFLEKGPAEDTLGIQIRDAVPLLVNFIETTDNYIHHPNSIDAYLRFAHAETISPFATLLGVRIASDPSSSIFKYRKHWQPSKIIPLSANIQWILYKNHRHYLIKVLLNEKEARLPLNTNTFPYYDWEKVKHYYMNKLSMINVCLNENMHQYLLNLK